MTFRHHQYSKAAKLKDADPKAIYETASDELNPRQLGELAWVLHAEHGYRLPKAERDPLIDRLLEDGLAHKKIAELLGCSPRTISRRQASQVGSINGLNKRFEGDKGGANDGKCASGDSDGYGPPILSFDARGGGDDTRLIQDVLSGKKRRWW